MTLGGVIPQGLSWRYHDVLHKEWLGDRIVGIAWPGSWMREWGTRRSICSTRQASPANNERGDPFPSHLAPPVVAPSGTSTSLCEIVDSFHSASRMACGLGSRLGPWELARAEPFDPRARNVHTDAYENYHEHRRRLA